MVTLVKGAAEKNMKEKNQKGGKRSVGEVTSKVVLEVTVNTGKFVKLFFINC